MGIIVGFGALNLDLIFEVEDFKSISSNDRNLGDVVQNYQFLLRDSSLIIAMAMAEVPTPKFWAISALEIPISRPK
jgi:hypothetical protein